MTEQFSSPESAFEVHTPSSRDQLVNEVNAALRDPNVDVQLGPEKAWVALIIAAVGSGLTSGIAFTTADSPMFAPLVIAGSVITTVGTALGVYAKRTTIR